jgi:glycosyltransferase involved in cell wall biosynthesis
VNRKSFDEPATGQRASTDWRAVCAAVIPCLNEARAIGPLVTAVRRHVPQVFVVNDGSADDTAACAALAGATVITHACNLGKGAALQSGWRRASETRLQWVLTLDGDGQHSAEDIPAFFELAERTGAAMVIGNRMHEPSGMPWLRRVVNRWMSARLSKAAGQELPDSQSGFRLISLPVLNTISVTTTHFEIESEVLLAFAHMGHRIEFVPIQAFYKEEQSKIHPLKDTLRWFHWWREAKRAFRGSRSLRQSQGIPASRVDTYAR